MIKKYADTARGRYDKENTIVTSLKLNKKTDADILAAISLDQPLQTQIKALIRKALSMEEDK